jgi:hypothetical protein
VWGGGTIHYPVVRNNVLGLVPVAMSNPTPFPQKYPHPFRISQGKVLDPLGRDRKEGKTIKGILKM